MSILIRIIVILFLFNNVAIGQQTINKLNVNELKLPKETAGKVLVIDGNKKAIGSTDVTSIELDNLDGSTSNIQDQLDSKEPDITATSSSDYFRGDKTFQPLDKSAVGLGSVDNTSDLNKPVSTDTQAALNLKADDSSVVHLSGSETISGDKTITGQVTASSITNGNTVCPAMTDSQMLAVVSPRNGDCVYNTTKKAPYYYSTVDVAWKLAGGGGGGSPSGSTELLIDPSFEDSAISDYSSLTGGTTSLSTGAPLMTSPTNEKMLAITVSDAGSVTFTKNTGSSYNGSGMRVGGWFYSTQEGDTVGELANGVLTGSTCTIALNAWTPCFFESTAPSTSYGYQVTWLTGAHTVYADLNTIAVDRKFSALVNLNQSQTSYILSSATFGNVVITGAVTASTGNGIYTYNSGTGVYTFIKPAIVSAAISFSNGAASSALPLIQKNGTTNLSVGSTKDSTGAWSNASATFPMNPGETFSFLNATASTTGSQYITVSATAQSPNIVTTNDTFSTDTAPLTYAGSSQYTLSTLANAPVGTFITFTYASSTNTRVQTNAAPPTQTISSSQANGMQITTRAYNAASNSTDVAVWAMQIGKGLKGVTLDLYKSVGKSIPGNIDSTILSSTYERGLAIYGYNELTGILIIDAGVTHSATVVNHDFIFSDITAQNFGYLVVNASRNPAMSGINISGINGMSTVAGITKPIIGFGFRSTAVCTSGTCPGEAFGTTISSNSATFNSTGSYDIAVPFGKCGSTPWCTGGIRAFAAHTNKCSIIMTSATALGVICTNAAGANVNEGFTIKCECATP